jgi:hypothetical protein
LIAVSQIKQNHSEVPKKDSAHQITSAFSTMDQNIENLEKLIFMHKRIFDNSNLRNMKDYDGIF